VISITCREPHLVFGARQKKIGAPNGGADGALPFAPCDPRRFGDLTYRPAVDRPNVTTEPRRFPRTQTTVAVKTTNVVPSDKFVRLLRGVIADAENVVILRLRIGDDELQVKSREISLHPIAPTLRIGSTAPIHEQCTVGSYIRASFSNAVRSKRAAHHAGTPNAPPFAELGSLRCDAFDRPAEGRDRHYSKPGDIAYRIE
jgi:hypothetical protein